MKKHSDMVHERMRLLDHRGSLGFSSCGKFNLTAVQVFRSGQHIPPHCDSVHDRNGHFVTEKNSQQGGSPVVIIAFGDTRTLTFKLVRYATRNGRTKKVRVRGPGTIIHVELKHGTAFILAYNDEVPTHRHEFGPEIAQYKTFWTHEGKGVGLDHGISVGITLRTCVHFIEVDKATGAQKLTKEEAQKDRETYKESHSLLERWCTGDLEEEKINDDKDLSSSFFYIRRRYHNHYK